MKTQDLVADGKISLRRFAADYTGRLDKDHAKKSTDEMCRRIGDQQELLYANSTHAVLLLFQGMDASGKDGAIRSVLHDVNPAGVETANFKVPSAEEKAHDFLWRVHHAVPRAGNIGVFNRSHYEAVLAERVFHLAPRRVWSRRYEQIVDFERMLCENNVVLLKFYLHISRGEQAERFEKRLDRRKKNWKFASADLTAREHWAQYTRAYEDMLSRTSHRAARWHIVPSDHKWYRDHVVAQAVIGAFDALKLKWPKPAKGLDKIRIK
ncbi:MAG: Polyphosphate:nucleotide phosphotransferase, family [Verrucomicrobia bacterium]|nr:Polyphosphate:nucleotide phosphotransferase, family [Verrucomicrobiota bacterium]